MALTEVTWRDYENDKGGSVFVDSYGLSVTTDCCGCRSIQLTDVDDLIKLNQAIGELITARTGRRAVLFR